MAKRLIGVDIGAKALNIAILRQEQNQILVERLEESSHDTRTEQMAHLREVLHEVTFGDRMAAALPASSAYVRQLDFPFSDVRKCEAVLPFELAAQLPVPLDNCVTASYPLDTDGEGTRLYAAALPIEVLQSFLSSFDEALLPLQVVDLSPFCYVAGLAELVGNALLVCATEQETVLARVVDRQITDFRVLPGPIAQDIQPLARQLCREAFALQRTAELEALPLYLMGSKATAELASLMQKKIARVELLSLDLQGQRVEAPMLPAVALALRAGAGSKKQSFNFRQGRFALKGEWAGLRKTLIVATCLLVVTVMALAGALLIEYRDRAGQVQSLQQEITGIYRATFPGTQPVVDASLQMQSAVRELRDKGGLLGSGSQAEPLEVLKEISAMTVALSFEIQEFTYAGNEVKLNGKTDSFETVNRMAEQLNNSPMITRAQVAEAKMSLDGSQIDFRILLTLAEQGLQP